MTAYYNEIEPYAAQWLRNLIAAGHIAVGDVDERDIRDVRPDDLRGYTQCHFFAGIGVWSHALRRAGWPDDRPVWTGSCPCQPFSAAGRRGGVADERHLWPHWHWLIEQCRPPVVFGEQVASKDGLGWLDLVHADLEGAGYAVGAADLCAAGVGAPHIRQRLWFVADAGDERRHGLDALLRPEAGGRQPAALPEAAGCGGADRLGHPGGTGLEERAGVRGDDEPQRPAAERAGRDVGGVGDAEGERRQGRHPVPRPGTGCEPVGAGAANGFWADADWLPCRDGKARPFEPGTFPLAHGAPARVGRLRAYGNAIVAQAAAEFIGAWNDMRCGHAR